MEFDLSSQIEQFFLCSGEFDATRRHRWNLRPHLLAARNAEFKIIGTANFNQLKLQTERLCSELGRPLFIVRVIRIPQKCHFGDFWRSLFKKLKPFRSECILQERDPRRVSSRSTKAFDKTKLLRISATDEYKWDLFINLFRNRRHISPDGQDHVRLQPYQLACQNRKPVKSTFRISEFDHDVPPFDIAQVAEPTTDRCHLWVALVL